MSINDLTIGTIRKFQEELNIKKKKGMSIVDWKLFVAEFRDKNNLTTQEAISIANGQIPYLPKKDK